MDMEEKLVRFGITVPEHILEAFGQRTNGDGWGREGQGMRGMNTGFLLR